MSTTTTHSSPATGTVLITGASRGIGLELARQYVAEGWRVMAACRDPGGATALSALLPASALHPLDVRDGASVAALASALRGVAIDVLINNAGVFGPQTQGLTLDDYQGWLDTLAVNVLGPFRVVQALAPNVAASRRRLVATLSSLMGSIQDNTGGGHYAYRSSKAAVNMVIRSLALDLTAQGLTLVALHPGWVRTDMGGPMAPLSPEESVRSLRQTIASLKPEHNGGFFNYDGRPLPW